MRNECVRLTFEVHLPSTAHTDFVSSNKITITTYLLRFSVGGRSSFIKPTAAKSHSCVSCTLSSWDFLNLNVNDAFSSFFFLFACHQQQSCSSATNLMSGCALRDAVMMSYFCLFVMVVCMI